MYVDCLLDRFTVRSSGYECLHKHLLAICLTKVEQDDTFPYLQFIYDICLLNNKEPEFGSLMRDSLSSSRIKIYITLGLYEKDKKEFSNEHDLFVEKLAFLCHISRLLKDYHVPFLLTRRQGKKSLHAQVLENCRNLLSNSSLEAKVRYEMDSVQYYLMVIIGRAIIVSHCKIFKQVYSFALD
jgi:hypothetical protein